jgi:hypothetical protein
MRGWSVGSGILNRRADDECDDFYILLLFLLPMERLVSDYLIPSSDVKAKVLGVHETALLNGRVAWSTHVLRMRSLVGTRIEENCWRKEII